MERESFELQRRASEPHVPKGTHQIPAHIRDLIARADALAESSEPVLEASKRAEDARLRETKARATQERIARQQKIDADPRYVSEKDLPLRRALLKMSAGLASRAHTYRERYRGKLSELGLKASVKTHEAAIHVIRTSLKKVVKDHGSTPAIMLGLAGLAVVLSKGQSTITQATTDILQGIGIPSDIPPLNIPEHVAAVPASPTSPTILADVPTSFQDAGSTSKHVDIAANAVPGQTLPTETATLTQSVAKGGFSKILNLPQVLELGIRDLPCPSLRIQLATALQDAVHASPELWEKLFPGGQSAINTFHKGMSLNVSALSDIEVIEAIEREVAKNADGSMKSLAKFLNKESDGLRSLLSKSATKYI